MLSPNPNIKIKSIVFNFDRLLKDIDEFRIGKEEGIYILFING